MILPPTLSLFSFLLAVFLRTVNAWYRRQARAQGYTGVRCGSVTFVQRFRSAINLNPHFHLLLFDGVYVTTDDGAAPVFIPAPPLEDEDVQVIVDGFLVTITATSVEFHSWATLKSKFR